jgi:hypothetical protein
MSRTTDLQAAIAKNLQYALNDVKAGKDPSAHIAKAAEYAAELHPTAPTVAAPAAPAVPAPVAQPAAQPADPPEIVFDPSTWPPLAVAPGTVRAGKYGELFGSAIPGPGVYTDVQTSGGTWNGVDIPPMFYLFLRGHVIFAQEGNVDPAERIRLKTLNRPANTTGLTF